MIRKCFVPTNKIIHDTRFEKNNINNSFKFLIIAGDVCLKGGKKLQKDHNNGVQLDRSTVKWSLWKCSRSICDGCKKGDYTHIIINLTPIIYSKNRWQCCPDHKYHMSVGVITGIKTHMRVIPLFSCLSATIKISCFICFDSAPSSRWYNTNRMQV